MINAMRHDIKQWTEIVRTPTNTDNLNERSLTLIRRDHRSINAPIMLKYKLHAEISRRYNVERDVICKIIDEKRYHPLPSTVAYASRRANEREATSPELETAHSNFLQCRIPLLYKRQIKT